MNENFNYTEFLTSPRANDFMCILFTETSLMRCAEIAQCAETES